MNGQNLAKNGKFSWNDIKQQVKYTMKRCERPQKTREKLYSLVLQWDFFFFKQMTPYFHFALGL